ncbi:MAG: MiaB/RimO family radical SAM methylthiotransferase [Candidatus Cloacimonadaceae bacterium]
MKTKFGIISLGCPKNLVDSETFCDIAIRHGYELSDDFDGLDFMLVNTCSFIHDAIVEMRRVLDSCLELKKGNKIKRIYVTGCIMKRFLKRMQSIYTEIDAWIEIKDYAAFEKLLSVTRLSSYQRYHLADGPYSYLKISDGCNNRCSYCTIPSIRGKLKSSSMEDLIREATYLANTGARELIVIAQDTTAYGKDLYERRMLSELLKRLHDVPGFHWIRLMYLHPGHVDKKLVKTIAGLPKVVHAFEMPLQHSNDRILADMNRNYTKADIISVYNMFKAEMPDSVFRTTFITGFPGESRKDFNELMQFIQDYPFLRMGAFAYSREPQTPAFDFSGQVTERAAVKRKMNFSICTESYRSNIFLNMLGKSWKF